MAPKKLLFISYQVGIAALAVLSILLLVLDYAHDLNILASPYRQIDNVIWLILTLDYVVRLGRAKNKKHFLLHNVWDLLAILPVNQLFYLFRAARVIRVLQFLRVLRLVRLIGLTGRLRSLIKTRGLLYYSYLSFAVLLIAAVMYHIAEKVSFTTALWWSITTVSTVGYGDIAPTTGIGKLAAVILMVIGIGFIGMMTSSLTDLLSSDDDDQLRRELHSLQTHQQAIEQRLAHIEQLLMQQNGEPDQTPPKHQNK